VSEDIEDIHAAGAVLYELLTGTPPAANSRGTTTGRRRPPALGRVPHQLEQAISQALGSRTARKRPTAAEIASMLDPRTAQRRPQWQVWAGAATLALVIAVLAVAASKFLPGTPSPSPVRDTVLLADFRNTTGEPIFDRALNVALAVALEQSPFLRVLPDQRVRESLARMRRPANAPLTPPLAREIARREQVQALVAGTIGPLGTRYVLTLDVIDVEDGGVVTREQVEVARKEDILTDLGAAAGRLRGRLGESLASRARFDVPLPQATTGSLEALHAYALALEGGQAVPRAAAIPHLQRALELDPDFAMAHAALSGVYANTGRSTDAPPHARRAYALRDRVTERERFFIAWRYYVDAAQNWAQAHALGLSWTRTYPREPFAFNSLGMAAAAVGDHDEGVRAFQEAIRLDPGFVPPHGNLAGSLIALGRYSEARSLLEAAAARGVSFLTVRRMSYLLSLISGDAAGMAKELQLVRGSPDAMWAPLWEARVRVFGGRLEAAHAAFDEGVRAALAGGHRELAAQWTAEHAEAHAMEGDCDRARRELPGALTLSRDNFTLERTARTLAWCGESAEAARLSTELGERFPEATLVERLHRPLIAAAHQLRQGRAVEALALLEPVRPYDDAPAAELWPSYLRGQAYLLLRDGMNAAVQFDSILARRGQAPTSPLYPLAHLGRARAAALAGDRHQARRSFEAFFELWRDADASLALVSGARAEHAQVR
jgi:tetratricopeptide (TPR) repeat protein